MELRRGIERNINTIRRRKRIKMKKNIFDLTNEKLNHKLVKKLEKKGLCVICGKNPMFESEKKKYRACYDCLTKNTMAMQKIKTSINKLKKE